MDTGDTESILQYVAVESDDTIRRVKAWVLRLIFRDKMDALRREEHKVEENMIWQYIMLLPEACVDVAINLPIHLLRNMQMLIIIIIIALVALGIYVGIGLVGMV